MEPIYTLHNTTPAFQLNWSVALFGRGSFPPSRDWLEQLCNDAEADGVRILEFHSTQSNVGQFLVSTRPRLSPSEIVRSLKGRWQYHIHVLLGAGVTDSPADIALSLMNNLAYVQGMRPAYRFSYYVGTFGPYDRNAVRRTRSR